MEVEIEPVVEIYNIKASLESAGLYTAMFKDTRDDPRYIISTQITLYVGGCFFIIRNFGSSFSVNTRKSFFGQIID